MSLNLGWTTNNSFKIHTHFIGVFTLLTAFFHRCYKDKKLHEFHSPQPNPHSEKKKCKQRKEKSLNWHVLNHDWELHDKAVFPHIKIDQIQCILSFFIAWYGKKWKVIPPKPMGNKSDGSSHFPLWTWNTDANEKKLSDKQQQKKKQ